MEGDQVAGMAKILNMTPEDLQADLDAKNETITQFIDRYINDLARKTEAEKSSLTMAEQWAKKTQEYADKVGKSMGDAMADFILGEKSAKDALADFAKSIIENVVRILV